MLFEQRSPDDHYILYTGGTTGMPRGVVWRQEDIFFTALGSGNPGGPPIDRPEDVVTIAPVNTAQRVAPFLAPDDPGPDEFVALSLGPMMHASGQWLALGTLLGGGKIVMYDEPHLDMTKVLDLVERERVVMLSIVGDAGARPLVAALDDHPGRWDTSSLRLLGSGGLDPVGGDARAACSSRCRRCSRSAKRSDRQRRPCKRSHLPRRDEPTIPSLAFQARPGVTLVVDDDLRPVVARLGSVGLAGCGRTGADRVPQRSREVRRHVRHHRRRPLLAARRPRRGRGRRHDPLARPRRAVHQHRR